MAAAREPGIRAKIAVASNNSDIDPVGACVGMKGSRVQNVVQELRGEKIDIIPWHVDPAKFVCNALAPAEISRVIIDEDNRGMEVIVPDDFLSIAIGKKGQNVRLASKLTGWHLDVKSESQYSQDMQVGYDSLVSLPGVGVSLADALYERGLYSAEEISKATAEDLVQIRGIGPEKAAALLEAAQAMLEEESAPPVEPEADAEASEDEDVAEGAPEAEAPADTPAEDLDSEQETEMQSDPAENNRLPEDNDQPVSEEEPGSIS
jgi:N utilization substance protein A